MTLLLHAPMTLLLHLPNTLKLQAWRDSAQNQPQVAIRQPQVYAHPQVFRASAVLQPCRLPLQLYPLSLLSLDLLVLPPVLRLVFKVRTSSRSRIRPIDLSSALKKKAGLSPGEKAGIGVGSFVVVSLAGFG